MSLYHINEGVLDLPDKWSDRTMNIFTPDETENPEWNIVVSRDRLGEGETLSDYLDKQLAEMPQALPRFRLQSDEETIVDGTPAREVVSTWIGDGGTVRQKQVVMVKDDKSLVFTFTVLDRLYSNHSKVLDEFLKSFVFRNE